MPQRFCLQVGGGAHVRAGEEAEAAGVDLEALVDGELAGEVRPRSWRSPGSMS